MEDQPMTAGITVEQALRQRLSDQFSPQHFELDNESHQHSVPANSETHFRVVLVSDAFDGLRPVARHQKVYALVGDLMAGSLHALALHLYTPGEWAAREAAPDSPACRGGSRADQGAAS
jgi:BolA protein